MLRSVCSPLQPFGPPTASDRDGNAFLRFAPTLNSAWSSHTFAPPCANACAVFRPCGLRFAPCPRGSSRFAASDARKLACGSPCFIGLTTACFRHWRRPPCAPALRLRGVPALRTPFGRVLAPSALRAFTFSQAFALQKMPEMTYTPQFAMVVLLRLRACSTPLFIGLTTACFAHSARPSCAPSFLMKALLFRYFVNALWHMPFPGNGHVPICLRRMKAISASGSKQRP